MSQRAEPHPSPDDLHDFALGKLDALASDSISRHIETCPDCRRAAADASGDSFLDRLRDLHSERELTPDEAPSSGPERTSKPYEQKLHDPWEFLGADMEGVGTNIGPYKLLEPIGEGGMGVVYLAEQQSPVERRVAIKLIKHGMDSRQVIARFEAERQALAIMDHPNIARVLDAGTTPSGRPFFVMELVKGIPITRFCDEHHLTPRERLALFIPVCHAIQHAHQKGIIHRDLKPSNVLVAMYDDKAVPKVIDFGVAKATGQKLTERTMFTRLGQVVGTLEYMSPEQAAFNALDVDTRSDIYSLGVLLYELLTGTTPIEKERLNEAALDEMVRIIQHEDPPKPSTRLSTSKAIANIAVHRSVEPARLSELVKGDLDWIVMKALDKDRSRRYESATGLAHDVENYLNDEPVKACPPSVRYRLRKFLRRNRGPVTAGVALATLLVLAVVGTSIGMAWALRAESSAKAAAKTADEQRTDAEWQRDRAQNAETRANLARENELRQLFAADLLLASRAVTDGPLSRAIDLLDAWLPERRDGKDYRGPEWHLLRRLCDTSDRVLVGHDGPLRALAWTKDGNRIASAGADRVIRIWDAETGQCLQTLVGHAAGVFDVAFSPDGKLLVSASADATVRLWDVESGKKRHVMDGHILPVFAVAFHPDGQRVASAGGDTVIKVWDVSSGSEIFVLQGHEAAVTRLQFSSDGTKLASCGIVRGTKIWDLAKRQVIAQPSPSGNLVLTPDLGTGAFAYPTGEFGILDVEARAIDKRSLGLREIHALDLNANARLVALSADDDSIRVFDREVATTVVTHRGHIGAVRRVLLRFDARKLASAGDDGAVRIWSLPDPNESKPFSGHHQLRITAASFSRDGSRLASGDYMGSIAIWNAQTGKRELKLGSHYSRRKSQKTALEVGTGRPVEAGKTRLKNYTSFSASPTARDPLVECFTSEGHGGAVQGMSFTPDGKTLVSVGAQDLIIWNLENGTPSKEFEHPTLASSLALSSDGTLIATGCWDDIVRVFRVPSGELVKQLEGHADDVVSVAFHPNGKELATGGRDRTVLIWDLESGTVKHRLRRHMNTVSTVCYSPDGSVLVTGGLDKAIHVWDAITGQYESTLHGHTDGVASVIFSRDGKWLVSASDGPDEQGARIWLWNAGSLREGALIQNAGGVSPTAVAMHPLSNDLVMGRMQLTRFTTAPVATDSRSKAKPVDPELLRAHAFADDRLKVLGYALLDEIGLWPNSRKGRLKPSKAGDKFLVVAVSLPFHRMKISDADYRRLLEIKKKDPDATEPLKFSSMLIYPERFTLTNGNKQHLPAQFVGRISSFPKEGFEFMKKGQSWLENMTLTPQLNDREHVYLAWEVAKDFSVTTLRIGFENNEPIAVPSLVLDSFRPGRPFYPGSPSFHSSEGNERLRSNITRSPGP